MCAPNLADSFVKARAKGLFLGETTQKDICTGGYVGGDTMINYGGLKYHDDSSALTGISRAPIRMTSRSRGVASLIWLWPGNEERLGDISAKGRDVRTA